MRRVLRLACLAAFALSAASAHAQSQFDECADQIIYKIDPEVGALDGSNSKRQRTAREIAEIISAGCMSELIKDWRESRPEETKDFSDMDLRKAILKNFKDVMEMAEMRINAHRNMWASIRNNQAKTKIEAVRSSGGSQTESSRAGN